MGKKRQSGELKSVPIPLQVHRYKNLGTLRASARTYLNTDHLQPFFPPIETLFKTNQLENVLEYGIKFDDQIQSFTSKDTIQTYSGTKNVHIKSTMLVSPFKWMRGDYSTAIGLSTSQEQATTIHRKLQSPHNAAYVGALFSSVFSQTKCVHFPKVYGVFSGISHSHRIDISDDYPDLVEKTWFSQNIGHTFELKLREDISSNTFKHTRSTRMEVELGDTIELNDIEELNGVETTDTNVPEISKVFDSIEEEDDSDDSSSVSTSYLFEVHSCECEDKQDDTTEDEEDEEGFAWATFSNVPVEYTIMEKCEGTLYQLLKQNPNTTKHIAWLSQIMFALLFAQKTFGFVHNDLHSNNVMYVSTDKEYLYYKVAEKFYKVPTYGYILKIIDFERGTGSVRIAGMKDPKFFMSDHFSVNDEAGGQYNTEPFYNPKFPIVKPNPSFDLVRLATSLYWDLFPNRESDLPLHNIFMRWLTTEDGKSIMFSNENPKHERYHGFHLYKAIAKYCKENALPRKEIETLPFEVSSAPFSECLVVDV
jgi:hypothetical protein